MIHSRPYHPQGRGKNERFHRTLKAEVLALRRYRDLADLQRANAEVREILAQHQPNYIEPSVDSRIRERFKILI